MSVAPDCVGVVALGDAVPDYGAVAPPDVPGVVDLWCSHGASCCCVPSLVQVVVCPLPTIIIGYAIAYVKCCSVAFTPGSVAYKTHTITGPSLPRTKFGTNDIRSPGLHG